MTSLKLAKAFVELKFKGDKVYSEADKIKKKLGKARNESKKFNSEVRKINTKGLDNLNNQLDKSISKYKKLSLAISLPMALIGKSFIGFASDTEEAGTKFATIFDEVKDKSIESQKRFRKEFGTSVATTQSLLSQTGSLLSGLGFDNESNLKLSENIAKLALDLQSFNNDTRTSIEVVGLLVSLLTGETQAGKSLGIIANEEILKLELLKQKKEGLTFVTQQQAKANALYRIAVSQSQDAMGDSLRTADGYANSLRRFQEQWREFGSSVGENLLKPLALLFQSLNSVLKLFKVAPTFITTIIAHFRLLTAIIRPLKLGYRLLQKAVIDNSLAMDNNTKSTQIQSKANLGLIKTTTTLKNQNKLLGFSFKRAFSTKSLAMVNSMKLAMKGLGFAIKGIVRSFFPMLLVFTVIELAIYGISKAIDAFKEKKGEIGISKTDTMLQTATNQGLFKDQNKVIHQKNTFQGSTINIEQNLPEGVDKDKMKEIAGEVFEEKTNEEIKEVSQQLGGAFN